MANGEHDIRRAAIQRIIRSRQIGTQEELREFLAREGFDVTQATLSRDLAKLGARRVSRPEGGAFYEVGELRAPEGAESLLQFRGMVNSVVATDALVVVHTPPGAASAVALGIDRARLNQIAGTIAGDDCIFIAPSRGISSARIARELSSMWLEKEQT
ncbi:MAG: arginine repressor [Myxococcaceae bacterium]